MATATFPDLIKQTYTYNSPGAKNLDIPEIYEENGVYFRKDYENIFGVEKLVTTEITKNLYDAYNLYKNNNSLESVNQKVINIRGEDAFGAGITELGEDIGSDGIEFFINTDNALVNVPAHSVSTLEKSLYFYATLMTIDSSLDSETITQEMVKFKNNYTNSTNIISNDLTIFDNYLNRISDLFNNKISYEKNQENGNSVVDFYIEFTKSEFNQYKNLNLEFLTTKTQTQLQDKTLANLYALENLNPFVIEGDFEVYNNIDVSKYTDQYLEDRATYLYYLLDKENRYDIDPTLSMTAYEDVELGSEYTLEQSFSKSKIVFGGDSDNTLIGGDGSDRLYAGLGNDTIEAGAGTNYIDGGTGSDTISYKSSTEAVTVDLSLSTAQSVNSTTTDTLVSIENVIGSAFNDKITGNSQDNDLVGGKGNDTYVFNKTSQNDTIIDSEGIDEIIFGVGIFLEKLEFFRTGTDLLIKFKNDDMKNSSLTINSFFLDKNSEIEKIKFLSDHGNNIVNLTEYLELNEYITIGTNLDDKIYSNRDINVVYGLEGKDYIYGNNESKLNILYGGSPEDAYNTGEYTSSTSSSKFDLYYKTAEDYITGGSSANTNLDFENYLYGGKGNDLLSSGENVSNYLYGGAGDDFLRTSLSISDNGSFNYLDGGMGFDKYLIRGNQVIIDDYDQ
jgi:Ca2+-binding RTX toxin-like protein